MRKIKGNSTIEDVIKIMGETNLGALSFLKEYLLNKPDFFFTIDILLLDQLDVRGDKLYLLWKDCCKQDIEKFHKTVRKFKDKEFSYEQIHENLSQVSATPFI